MDVGLYEYPENAKILKVKMLFDFASPIRAGMYIGNEVDGVNWVDFRYENLPMFCFGCGLVGHNEDNCYSPFSFKLTAAEGSTNPRGAWLRSKVFGRRMVEKKDKIFSSNPMKSVSGSLYSPIPRSLMHKMAKINLNQQTPATNSSSPSSNFTTRVHQQETKVTTMRGITLFQAEGTSHALVMEDPKFNKRKISEADIGDNLSNAQQSSNYTLAGLMNKASQSP